MTVFPASIFGYEAEEENVSVGVAAHHEKESSTESTETGKNDYQEHLNHTGEHAEQPGYDTHIDTPENFYPYDLYVETPPNWYVLSVFFFINISFITYGAMAKKKRRNG